MKILTLLISLFFMTSAMAEDLSQIKFELLLAKRGDLSAQLRIASAFENGTDVKKNLVKALKWYTEAAKQSHAPSQYKVGYFHENGMGVSKNIKVAMDWYNKAKSNGSDEASQRLDKTAFEKSKKESITKRAALQARLDKEEKARKAKINADKKTKAVALAKKVAKEKKQAALSKKKAKKDIAKKKAKIDITKKKSQKVIAKKNESKKKKVKPIVVAAKNKSKPVKIPKMLKHVLNNKWKNNHGAADYLPSASTSCLESGDNELTCFSSEKTRKLNGAKVTFTAKSTLFGFRSNGNFKVVYNYNGIRVSGAKSNAADLYGLTMKQGWQEPAIAISCRATDRKNLTCYRGNKKVSFKL